MYNIYSSFIQGILLILIGVSCTLPLGSERTHGLFHTAIP